MGNLIRKHGEDYKILSNDLLKRCCTITGFKNEEIRNEHRKFFSIAESGRLKKSHMEELLGDYLPTTKRKHSKYFTKCVFSAIDTNNDGYIDFLEYLMSVRFFRTESPIEKADFIFRIIDKNGDHRVSKEELERTLICLQEFRKSLTNNHAIDVINDDLQLATHTIFEILDEDKSGFIGVSEFKDAWLKNETIRALFTF
ncbi:unnamed protein product [Rotaria sordida]|uniref:EF-hand domain-containing protein n=1 Tax=Rotaria sordida TaxID=392033 RepID=A0A813UIA2_9BILA|nr:unnamed protein product [Rotaria sordida]CAF0824941.1 unnamed protein product [Rotaria sordida]CAF0846531.1 unnamed protein product [Rotaria sordida]CAF0853082.1 unnamed protein product [Rotaria sordida]CAF3868493.1 unnamed protein product [Rotaria sordida]